MPRVIAIIQGRMTSSRLPGKILADIAGQPMLQRVFIRTSRAATVTETIFATTTDSTDDPVAEYCGFSGIPFTRGSLYDVLDRYYQTAKQAKADVVVRVTADCPVIDPALVDDAVNTLIGESGIGNRESGFDFVCNRLPPPWTRTYPIGLDVEACTFKVLDKAWKETKELQHREHVMPYFYEGVEISAVSRRRSEGVSPRGFRIALLNYITDFGDYRWTVDTPEDLEFMREVYAHFNGRDDFTWKEVLDLVHDNPELAKINAAVQHKTLKDIDKRALKK
ncbi:MAG: glycosyltransferase family protein [Chloroflexi bacterium]|nr:glycosyltransferase family protein [Chloroflexota bacterium]MBI1856338.1 glycosyltransferase family protein [Chloroflexota bacterium]MBI3338571.1 glycosyltransferase family protein [Chloroflexota bacterium]